MQKYLFQTTIFPFCKVGHHLLGLKMAATIVCPNVDRAYIELLPKGEVIAKNEEYQEPLAQTESLC
jgi:hypothetical protein